MATLASRTSDIQGSSEWLALEGPTLILDETPYRTYQFKGLRQVKDVDAGELVTRILYVYDEGGAGEEAEWKAEDPVPKPFYDDIIAEINSRISTVAEVVGVVPGSVQVDTPNLTALYLAIEDNAGTITVEKMAIVVNRSTSAKTHVKLATVPQP